MNKEKLLELLKEHLTIRFDEEYAVSTKNVRVSIIFAGEEIDADSFRVDI
jgi:hypothetical protein